MGYYRYGYNPERERRKVIIIASVIAIAVFGIALGLYLTFRTRKVAYQVKGAQWIATTNLREKTQRHTAHWGQPKYSSAFNVHCERRLYDTYDCNCVTIGGDQNGLGGTEICSTCEDWKDWCSYDYYDWPVIGSKSNTGHPDSKPEHPILKYTPPNQRLEMLTEYPVLFANEEGESHSYNARDLQELRNYRLKDWWEVDVNYAGKFAPSHKLVGEYE